MKFFMFPSISKIHTWTNLFRVAFYKYKKMLFVLTGLGFLSGILGGVGVGAVVPLFSFVSSRDGMADDSISKIFQKVFALAGLHFSLSVVITTLISLFVFKAFFLYIANLINAKIGLKYEAETRNDLFRHTLKANWPHLINHKIGYLSQTITEDVNASAGLLINLSFVILSLTSFLAYAAVAIGISLRITLVTILIGIAVFIFLKPLFYQVRKLSKHVVAVSKEVSHYINQYLIGAKTAKSMAVEEKILEKAQSYSQKLAELKFDLAKRNSILGAFLEPLTLAVIIPIFLWSYKNPSFNIASFAAILYLVQKMFAFVQTIQIRVSLINQGIPHLISVMDYQAEARKYRERSVGGNDFRFDSSLRFENVKFYYEKEKILNGLNFIIRKGEMVGLIGYSGSGKTTIADLILRLFNPKEGRITVDGANIDDINLEKWRRNIGYVSQDIFLLNDTIANNIRFYDDNMSDGDIIRAAELVGISGFIMQQPDKFDTVVGERGLKLSVGQRQRITLARVLSRRPQVLILDEATSALDNESEMAIHQMLKNLRGQVTILVIAHRLSTIEDSDRLLVLDDGKIVEEGSPHLLIEDKNSYFYKVYHGLGDPSPASTNK